MINMKVIRIDKKPGIVILKFLMIPRVQYSGKVVSLNLAAPNW